MTVSIRHVSFLHKIFVPYFAEPLLTLEPAMVDAMHSNGSACRLDIAHMTTLQKHCAGLMVPLSFISLEIKFLTTYDAP